MKSDRSVLRLDRRLIGRRDWIAPEALQQVLETLPDLSHKLAPPEEDAPKAGGEPASSAG